MIPRNRGRIIQVKSFIKFSSSLEQVVGQFIKPEKAERWLMKYAMVNNRSLDDQKGFILKNGTFERFEPIGITWNDSYCRRITETGPSGCFVERDLSTTSGFNYQENNCTGKDSTNLFRQVGILNMIFLIYCISKKRRTSALDLNGSSVKIAHSIFLMNLIVR